MFIGDIQPTPDPTGLGVKISDMARPKHWIFKWIYGPNDVIVLIMNDKL